MKKLGFTLAEVLITMTIIGVVAALTTPALFHHANNAQVGPMLAKIKATIENAHQQLMQDEEVGNFQTLLEGAIGGDNALQTENNLRRLYFQLLSDYMRLEVGTVHDTLLDYYGNRVNLLCIQNGTNEHGITAFNSRGMQILRNSMAYDTVEGAKLGFLFFGHFDKNMPGSEGIPIGFTPDNVAMIFVDINGNTVPNRFGKDIFAFFVRNDGMLIPYGSQGVGNNPVYRVDWQDLCNPDKETPVDPRESSAGLACTATIFENGQRVTYDE